jgi:PcfJ-like protein
MKKKSRSEREQQMLVSLEKEQVIRLALQFSKKRFKKFEEIIHQLYMNEDLSSFFSDKRIWKINECFKAPSSKSKANDRKILRDVLVHLCSHSSLVSDEQHIQAVYKMVQFRAYWRNDVFNWKAASKQGAIQVKELAAYLFCKYKVPDFLYKCFYETKNDLHIYWLIHIGRGGSTKEMGSIPIPFTKKMGHHFLLAPAEFSVAEALRWAQVKGLSGEDALAKRIAYSWIGTKPYSNEEFWETFLQLLVNGGMFNHNKITELIDYVREAKRENRNYSLKGRTLQSLVRQSDAWHNRFTKYKGNFFWKPCGIEGYKAEKKPELIVLEELTESSSLREEGRAMKHCVATYSYYCAKGKSAIFSMRKYSGGLLLEIMATIEVNLSLKRIVQAKARMNKAISPETKKHLQVWAMNEGLEVNQYI